MTKQHFFIFILYDSGGLIMILNCCTCMFLCQKRLVWQVHFRKAPRWRWASEWRNWQFRRWPSTILCPFSWFTGSLFSFLNKFAYYTSALKRRNWAPTSFRRFWNRPVIVRLNAERFCIVTYSWRSSYSFRAEIKMHFGGGGRGTR